MSARRAEELDTVADETIGFHENANPTTKLERRRRIEELEEEKRLREELGEY